MRGRSLSLRFDTLTLPVDRLKAAARRVRGKLNDAFVAGVAGGLRRYHTRRTGARRRAAHEHADQRARSGTAAVAGNQFVPARFVVPVGIARPASAWRPSASW